MVSLIISVLIIVGSAMLWQQLRYLRTRREAVQDHQPLVYPSSAFHVVTFLRVDPGADAVEEVRKLFAAMQSFGSAQWIYAGKVVLTGNRSSQIGPVDWSAIVMLQYPSREAYEQVAGSKAYREALSAFAKTYSQGFARPAAFNLLVHQVLLARRVRQILAREPSHFPFVRKEGVDADFGPAEAARRLLAERELGARAAVVVNLQKKGTAEQQASDQGYTGRMMAAMAEGAYGPMHLGRAVQIEADYDFDAVAIVYYPGVEFFAEMLRSDFFQGIIGGKQLGDTQATITVPILDQL
jgi:hypothetical protein